MRPFKAIASRPATSSGERETWPCAARGTHIRYCRYERKKPQSLFTAYSRNLPNSPNVDLRILCGE